MLCEHWAFQSSPSVVKSIACAGLDFSSSQLSLPLSVSGVALMVWSLVFFPMVQRRLGARACAVLGLLVTVFLSVALGCTSYLAKAGVSVPGIIVALTAIMVLKACFQQLCFPTSMVRPLPVDRPCSQCLVLPCLLTSACHCRAYNCPALLCVVQTAVRVCTLEKEQTNSALLDGSEGLCFLGLG